MKDVAGNVVLHPTTKNLCNTWQINGMLGSAWKHWERHTYRYLLSIWRGCQTRLNWSCALYILYYIPSPFWTQRSNTTVFEVATVHAVCCCLSDIRDFGHSPQFSWRQPWSTLLKPNDTNRPRLSTPALCSVPHIQSNPTPSVLIQVGS